MTRSLLLGVVDVPVVLGLLWPPRARGEVGITMNQDLIREIERAVMVHDRLEVLSMSELNAYLDELVRTFGFRDGDAWWWSHPSKLRKCVEYGSGDGLGRMLELLPEGECASVVACVTDDDPPPWVGLRGPAEDIVGLLRGLPFVEYFFAGLRSDWVVFDTHHNELVSYTLY